MRILFVLLHPGFLRYYDSTIRELAARGHDVEVAFDGIDKQSDGLKALTPPPAGVRVLGEWPVRRDEWRDPARGIRALGDCIRYLDPAFADADYLRERMFAMVPNVFPFRPLSRIRTLPHWLVRFMQSGIKLAERAVPVDARIGEFLSDREPDLVVVTPMVSTCGRQTDLVKAARAMRIPCVAGIASWDNLSSKGLVRTQPDRILVWNDAQRNEAIDLHGVPSKRIVVTGAQTYDRWFDREPQQSRGAFLRQAGLREDQPYVLFVGSSASISEPEVEYRFVKRWVDGLREAGPPQLRNIGVMIRPYPYNREAWSKAERFDPDVAVWPRDQANLADDADRETYFSSLYHASAIIGINTSAMVEAAIIGRPVLTIRADEFRHSQGGTLHFRYLADDANGFVRTANNLEEHYRQLDDAVSNPVTCRDARERFVTQFIRPFGRREAALPRVVDAMLDAASQPAIGPEKNGVMERSLRMLFQAVISKSPWNRRLCKA